MEAASIAWRKAAVLLLTIAAACGYGIIHDQITARICVEYFTVAHPPIFRSISPTVLGFCWGIAATIGIGAILGELLASVTQSPGLPPYPIERVAHSILILLGTMALSACLAGIIGYELSRHAIVHLPVSFAARISVKQQDSFTAVWFAHIASYLAGLTGGTILILRIWRQRNKPHILPLIPETRGAIIRALILAAIVAFVLYHRFHATR